MNISVFARSIAIVAIAALLFVVSVRNQMASFDPHINVRQTTSIVSATGET